MAKTGEQTAYQTSEPFILKDNQFKYTKSACSISSNLLHLYKSG